MLSKENFMRLKLTTCC